MRWRVLLIVVLVAGCAAPDPYAFEKRQQSSADTRADSLTRAVMGGRDPGRSNVPLTGPMAGGSADSQQYMKQQETALKAELDNTGVTVSREGEQIRLIMPGNITFASDSSALQPGFLPVLESVAAILRRFDHTVLEVAGHTDSRGSKTYNQQLSEVRADAVADFLQEVGVSRERLKRTGRGESVPLASNKTEAGRARNRRVELNIRSR